MAYFEPGFVHIRRRALQSGLSSEIAESMLGNISSRRFGRAFFPSARHGNGSIH